MQLNSTRIIPVQGNLLPELSSFVKDITTSQPVNATVFRETLEQFCIPWTEQQFSGGYIHHSMLTPSGYPVEFSFRSDTQDICYTAEPGLPQSAPAAKAQFITGLTPQFDFTTGILQQLSVQAAQRFGNWVSVRHKNGQSVFKLYQEITPGGYPLFYEQLVTAIPALKEIKTRLRPMLAGFTGSGATIDEFYMRIDRPDISLLRLLFDAAGTGASLSYIRNILSYLTTEEVHSLLGWLHTGISYRAVPGKLPELSLFVHAPQIFSTNAIARKRILGLARQIGGEMPVYEAVTAKLLHKDVPYPLHSIITLKVADTGSITCAAGLSPWRIGI